MYLVNTSVWLERLLDQKRSDKVKIFLDEIPSSHLSITNFAYHSIGVITTQLDKNEAFVSFTNDLFEKGSVKLIRLSIADTSSILETIDQYNFDFDDAYQYVVAKHNELKLVTLDQDFQNLDINILSPDEATKNYRS